MNDKLVDVLIAHAEVSSAFEALTESEKHLDDVMNLMDGVDSLVREVQTFGYTEMTNEHIKNQKGLEDLVHLSTDKIIQFKATEGLLQGAAEGFKKFIQVIKDFIQKVIVYLQHLFNTFGNKCRTLMMNLQNIQMDKKVQTITKETFVKISIVTKESREFIKEHIGRHFNTQKGQWQFKYLADTPRVIAQLVNRGCGVFKSSGPYNLQVDNSIFEFKESTLGEAGWEINDCKKLIDDYYSDGRKTYTEIGAMLNRIFAEHEAWDMTGPFTKNAVDIRTCIRMDAVVYSLLSKIQHTQVRQIIAFYKCLGPGIKLAEGDDGHLLGYKEAA